MPHNDIKEMASGRRETVLESSMRTNCIWRLVCLGLCVSIRCHDEEGRCVDPGNSRASAGRTTMLAELRRSLLKGVLMGLLS